MYTVKTFYNIAVFKCFLSIGILVILAKEYFSLTPFLVCVLVFLAGACIETHGFDGRSHSPENLC